MSTHDHAEFAPSSMGITIQCPGSWRMQRQYPALEGLAEAAEGEAAHWVMAQFITPGAIIPKINDLAPNGVPVTREMLDGAELYFEAVGSPQHVEQTLPACEDLHPQNWGTPDSWSYTPALNGSGAVIDIQDFKFGHRFVDVYMNWQLLNYLFLIVAALRLDGLQEQHTVARFKIVQPRNYHPQGPIRTWTVRVSELRAMRNTIRAAILAALEPDAPLRVGPECRDCTARAHCSVLQQASFTALDEAGKATPIEMTIGAMGLELRMINQAIERLKARQSGLEEVTLATIKMGKMVPGFTVITGKGRERWKATTDEVVALGALLGKTVTRIEPITPKQAIKAGVPADLVAMMSETPNGETKLAPDDGTLARRTFGLTT